MKKVLLLIPACIMLATTLCSCAGFTGKNTETQPPATSTSQPYQHRYPGDYGDKDFSHIKVTDYDKNDITEIAIDLWFAANEVYNVDDNQLFDMGDWVALFPQEPEYVELKNFDEIVATIFTDNGKSQIIKTHLSHGQNAFIQRKDNKVYRLGPWRTGYSYAFMLEDMEIKSADKDTVVITVKHEKPGRPFEYDPNYIPEYTFVDFTIKKTNGIWLVEDYIFPEATTE